MRRRARPGERLPQARAISPSGRPSLPWRAGDEQVDALDVLRQIGGEGDRAVPFRPFGRRRIDAGAGDREAAAEGVEVQGLAGDAADAAADEEILIQNGDRAERGFGIDEDLAQDRIEGGLALGLGLLGLLGEVPARRPAACGRAGLKDRWSKEQAAAEARAAA